MCDKSKICIVIPIGRSIKSSSYEIASFINTCHVLKDYDKFIVTTQTLEFDYMQSVIDKENVHIKRLSDSSFGSIGRYSRTFMQESFYRDFDMYEYMLIIHTNAWIFRDELEYWSNKEYDCIAAPWCQYCSTVTKCNYDQNTSQNIIGNGGLALRKIKKFIEITNKIKNDGALDKYAVDDTPAEDWFLATYPGIEQNVPKCNEALHFSSESPLIGKHINGGINPMGYHNLINTNQNAMLVLHFNNMIKNIIASEFSNQTNAI